MLRASASQAVRNVSSQVETGALNAFISRNTKEYIEDSITKLGPSSGVKHRENITKSSPSCQREGDL